MDRKTLKELVAEAKDSVDETVWRAYRSPGHGWRGEAVYASLERAQLLTAIFCAEELDALPDVTLEWKKISHIPVDFYQLRVDGYPNPVFIEAERARPGTH